MESVSTGISLFGTLYEQKGPIKELLDKLSARWLGKKSRLVVTGMAGVGKTTLVDCLSGRVFTENYRLPGRSTKVEHTAKTVQADSLRDEPKKRLVYSVIPGQESSVRRVGFAELLSDKSEVIGLIHVVGNGLATLDSITELETLKYAGVRTLDEYRTIQLERELADLNETCTELERYMVATRRPIQMILAVNKIDLFHETLGDVLALYASPDGPFVQRLQQLQSRVGSLYFQWEIAPVCSWLADFTYNGQVQSSTLKQIEFRQYLIEFLSKIIARL